MAPAPFFARGLVVGKFSSPPPSYQLLLEAAAAQVAELVVLVYSDPNDPAHPAATRANWLREWYRGDELADSPRIGATPLLITALSAGFGVLPEAMCSEAYLECLSAFLEDHAYCPDVVFASEACGPDLAACLGATYVAL